jgi:hypothetical protein
MMLCLNCGFQRPNRYKSYSCPQCQSYLKYIDGPAKRTAVKLHTAGLHISYVVAEVYSYDSYAIHTVNICVGLAQPYQTAVFRSLPVSLGYILPNSHDFLNHSLAPVATYGLLRYEIPYLDRSEARAMLKQKLKELDDWIDEAIDWLAICNLGGLL